ncbi:MAG TPA: pitrilysin family protein [Gammaproteobacteria bacterium]|nr:pitrilysin family protein [Gammaproteobacteria bacterium]
MIKRRNPISRNIWWLLAIVIVLGVSSNFFFMKHMPEQTLEPTSHEAQSSNPIGPVLDIQTWKTTRGLNTFYLPIETLPIVDIQLVFSAGSVYDGATSGLAQLTNQMIAKNTSQLTTDTITEIFESLGAQVGRNVTRDASSISLRTLSFDDERQQSITLLADVLRDIFFSETTFSIEKQQLLTQLTAQAQSPQAQSMKTFYSKIYGTHPYASPVTGTLESVNALNLALVREFFYRYYNLNNAKLIIVGDVTTEEAQQIAEQFDAALNPGDLPAPLPVVELPAATIIEHVHFPSAQTHILVGLPTMEKGNPDFFAFYLGNEILGGSGLSSQLFEIVREQQGLAYSVASQLIPLKQKGPFVIGLQTRSDASAQALDLVQSHLTQFIENGPSQEELDKTKQNISGQFLMAFNSNAAIAQNIAVLAFYDLPLDYYNQYLENINAVTLFDIRRAFHTYVGSQNKVTVTLGVGEVNNTQDRLPPVIEMLPPVDPPVNSPQVEDPGTQPAVNSTLVDQPSTTPIEPPVNLPQLETSTPQHAE